MLVQDALDNEPVTVSEVRDALLQIRRERGGDDVGYAQRRSLDHVEKFSKLSIEEAQELRAALEDMAKVTPELAVKLVDVMPDDADGVRAIYSKERFALDGEKIEEILGLLEEYR